MKVIADIPAPAKPNQTAEKAVDAVVDFFITPSAPTPEMIEAQREAQEEKAQDAIDWNRYKADEAYRKQIDEHERMKRVFEERYRRHRDKRER